LYVKTYFIYLIYYLWTYLLSIYNMYLEHAKKTEPFMMRIFSLKQNIAADNALWTGAVIVSTKNIS